MMFICLIVMFGSTYPWGGGTTLGKIRNYVLIWKIIKTAVRHTGPETAAQMKISSFKFGARFVLWGDPHEGPNLSK